MVGRNDHITKEFISKRNVFADVFNYSLYGGKQVIEPESLVELDTNEHSKNRDILKSATVMTDNNLIYAILGIENQSYIDYGMPVRTNFYDSSEYDKQLKEIERRHRELKDLRGDEYLSGISKKDKLKPVVTQTIYFGDKLWDGATSIRGMMGDVDENILSKVTDYKMNLIVPAQLEEEELGRFNSQLKEVLSFIKYANDESKMEELLEKDNTFHHMDREAVEVINAYTNLQLELNDEEKEDIDMCLAWDMHKERGRTEGQNEAIVGAVKALMDSTSWSLEQALDALKISEADRPLIINQLS